MSNAGITADMLVLRMSDDDFTSVLDTNLTGGFRRGPAGGAEDDAGPLGAHHLHRRRSSAPTGQAGQANYAASKAGLVGLARSLAREFASRNITVNVVAPGPISTDMIAALSATTARRIIERGAARPASAHPTRSPAPSASSPPTPPPTSPAR